MSIFKYIVLSAGLWKFLSVSSRKTIFKIFHRNPIIKECLEVIKYFNYTLSKKLEFFIKKIFVNYCSIFKKFYFKSSEIFKQKNFAKFKKFYPQKPKRKNINRISFNPRKVIFLNTYINYATKFS